MKLWRSVALGISIAAAPPAAHAQFVYFQYPTPDVPSNPWPGAPAESTVTRTYPSDEIGPSQRVESRRLANGVEIVTSTILRPDVEGRMGPSVETTTETVRPRPNVVRTRRDMFVFDPFGRRMLAESRQSEEATRADGSIDTVRTISSPGVTGAVTLTSREIEHTRSASRTMRETETTVFLPGPGETLIETEHVHQTERQVAPGVVRRESTRSLRDVNGRFATAETRSQDIRTAGPSDHQEEETIQHPDVVGKLAVDERTVVRRSKVNGRQHESVETFSADGAAIPGTVRLNQRIDRTTTLGADGVLRTEEAVDARSPSAPGEPLRPAQRSVSTIINIDRDYFELQRQMFEVDVNHQMVPRIQETGTATAPRSNER